MNVKKDDKGAIIGAGSNTVQLEGNVYLGGGMDNAGAMQMSARSEYEGFLLEGRCKQC